MNPVPAVGLDRGLLRESLALQGQNQIAVQAEGERALCQAVQPAGACESKSTSMPRYTVLPTPVGPSTPRKRGVDGRLRIDSMTRKGKLHNVHGLPSGAWPPHRGHGSSCGPRLYDWLKN